MAAHELPRSPTSSHDLQVLAALDALKKTRRRLHRFGWLVEACNRYQQSEEDRAAQERDGGGEGRNRVDSVMTTRGRGRSNAARGDGSGGRDRGETYASDMFDDDEGTFAGASTADVHAHVIECILMLINAVVGFPEELKVMASDGFGWLLIASDCSSTRWLASPKSSR